MMPKLLNTVHIEEDEDDEDGEKFRGFSLHFLLHRLLLPHLKGREFEGVLRTKAPICIEPSFRPEDLRVLAP